jgi:phage tail sheath protein FI
MPVTPTYPGVYIEEIPSGVRSIVGVATSITAFIGRALRGPLSDPVRVQSFPEFERLFGGLWIESTLGYSVQQFFLNGGTDALIVRVARPNAAPAKLAPLSGAGGDLLLGAASPGTWGNRLRARVDWNTRDPGDPSLFNLFVTEFNPPPATSFVETFRNVAVDPNHPRFLTHVLEEESQLVRVSGAAPTQRPAASAAPPAGLGPFDDKIPLPTLVFVSVPSTTLGSDGDAITDADVLGIQVDKTGLYALEKADLFNLMVIPPLTRDDGGDVAAHTFELARAYCKDRRAMLIADSPSAWATVPLAVAGADAVLESRDENAAVYFPRIRAADSLKENRLEEFAPSGAIAGIFARTDTERGVWKAPAGRDATLAGVRELTVKMTDPENGQLNPLAINCLRTFPVAGNVVWGSRTYRGADVLADQWKYIPVRRLGLYIEESLYRGTQWVVFEPNDEPLWAQIRLNVGAFMHDLFRKGAFQGSSPRDAYLVKCDKDTTTQNDINLGIVNVLVGFAPLKPAEFVILKIQQLAGNVQT